MNAVERQDGEAILHGERAGPLDFLLNRLRFGAVFALLSGARGKRNQASPKTNFFMLGLLPNRVERRRPAQTKG